MESGSQNCTVFLEKRWLQDSLSYYNEDTYQDMACSGKSCEKELQIYTLKRIIMQHKAGMEGVS